MTIDEYKKTSLVERLRSNARWHVVEEGDYLEAANRIEDLERLVEEQNKTLSLFNRRTRLP